MAVTLSYGAVKSTVVRAAASYISTTEYRGSRVATRIADTFSRCTSWQGGARGRAAAGERARYVRAAAAPAALHATPLYTNLCKQQRDRAGETHTYEADQDGDLNLQLTMVSFADAKAKKGETYVVYAATPTTGAVASVYRTPWRNGWRIRLRIWGLRVRVPSELELTVQQRRPEVTALCVLRPGVTDHAQIDLLIGTGNETVKFSVTGGSAKVHITGYEVLEERRTTASVMMMIATTTRTTTSSARCRAATTTIVMMTTTTMTRTWAAGSRRSSTSAARPTTTILIDDSSEDEAPPPPPPPPKSSEKKRKGP